MLNCFVIMPFSSEFDDVYGVIKSTVESLSADGGRCFRLDDSRPAGRITDRLLVELRSASICIADLTGHKPNVMWEVGFAMALSKPTLLVTQDLAGLPFDIKDMQGIAYDRGRLNVTLATPLKRSLLDTVATLRSTSSGSDSTDDRSADALGLLKTEVAQLREMVSEVVSVWKEKDASPAVPLADMRALEGDWLSTESASHIYARVVRGELVAPYCFAGDDHLVGVYYAWRRIGEYWFARYKWLERGPAGFSFLKMDSLDVLNGAWWSSDQEPNAPSAPPRSAGVPAHWVRRRDSKFPRWAKAFLERCEKEGPDVVLGRI